MSYCGPGPGLCGHQPNCPDHNCPGRPIPLDDAASSVRLHRLVQVDGGEQVDTERKSHAVDYLMAALVVFFVLGLAAVSVFK